MRVAIPLPPRHQGPEAARLPPNPSQCPAQPAARQRREHPLRKRAGRPRSHPRWRCPSRTPRHAIRCQPLGRHAFLAATWIRAGLPGTVSSGGTKRKSQNSDVFSHGVCSPPVTSAMPHLGGPDKRPRRGRVRRVLPSPSFAPPRERPRRRSPSRTARPSARARGRRPGSVRRTGCPCRRSSTTMLRPFPRLLHPREHQLGAGPEMLRAPDPGPER